MLWRWCCLTVHSGEYLQHKFSLIPIVILTISLTSCDSLVKVCVEDVTLRHKTNMFFDPHVSSRWVHLAQVSFQCGSYACPPDSILSHSILPAPSFTSSPLLISSPLLTSPQYSPPPHCSPPCHCLVYIIHHTYNSLRWGGMSLSSPHPFSGGQGQVHSHSLPNRSPVVLEIVTALVWRAEQRGPSKSSGDQTANGV